MPATFDWTFEFIAPLKLSDNWRDTNSMFGKVTGPVTGILFFELWRPRKFLLYETVFRKFLFKA